MGALIHPRCPRCHQGPLFASLLNLNTQCPNCGLNFESNMGDGPAYFTVLALGIIVMVAAGIVEFKYQPPFWLHIVLWVPAIFIGSVVCLRLFKVWLTGITYRQGHLKDVEKP